MDGKEKGFPSFVVGVGNVRDVVEDVYGWNRETRQ
jgi:hypothetical protein